MTKLEEVARAICVANGFAPDETVLYVYDRPGGPPGNSMTPRWRLWSQSARAAVEAMREPSEMQAMIARQYFGINPFEKTGPPIDQTWLTAYRAMIDAILSEGDADETPRQ